MPSRVTRRLCVAGLPLLLLPVWPPRQASSAPATPAASAWVGPAEWRSSARATTLQQLVDELRLRLAIPNPVVVSMVPRNQLLVSVERLRDRSGEFELSIEEHLVDGLSDEEVQAVLAHELGHVWLFTHHPYLHTEVLANEVALRLVTRQVLDRVYEKVWKRTGVTGTLQYLPQEAPPQSSGE